MFSKYYQVILQERHFSEDLGVYGRSILEWILNNWVDSDKDYRRSLLTAAFEFPSSTSNVVSVLVI